MVWEERYDKFSSLSSWLDAVLYAVPGIGALVVLSALGSVLN